MMLNQHLIGPSTSLSSNSALQSAGLNDGLLSSQKEDLKTQFTTREGTYRIMTLAEYSRPNRPQGLQGATAATGATGAATTTTGGAPVRVSFLTLSGFMPPEVAESSNRNSNYAEHEDLYSDKICFNVGRELYVYHYRGTHTAADLSRPIDKRVYKGTRQRRINNRFFSTGQLQMIDPLNKEYQASRLYNEDRFIDKTAVTCLRWVPGQPRQFLASYSSGNIYVFSEELLCPPSQPVYQTFKQGDKYTIYTCKTKTTKNPLYRLATGAIHQFAFSGPDAKYMATVGHDGYLRIFNYHQMELVALMKSYFGGLLTLSWSPDAKLIATGGEDDLLTVYSVAERRVVCRGQGHKSWISQVQFDAFCCTTEEDAELNGYAAAEEATGIEAVVPEVRGFGNSPSTPSNAIPNTSTADANAMTPVMRAHAKRATPLGATSTLSRCSFASFGTINGAGQVGVGVCYRIGSVGHDTQLCLWDITEDMLKPANVQRHRNSTIIAPMLGLEIQTSSPGSRLDPLAEASPGGATSGVYGVPSTSSDPSPSSAQTPQKPEKQKKKRFHRRGFTLGRLSVGGGSNSSNQTLQTTLSNGSDRRRANDSTASSPQTTVLDDSKILGTKICPRIEDVPVIEPLMCKRIAHERLTVLDFRRDCVVTACQEGFICTWARPGRSPAALLRQRELLNMNSPGTLSPETRERSRDRGLFDRETPAAPPRSASAYSANGHGGSSFQAGASRNTDEEASPGVTASVSGYNWSAM
ncbi:unnamed protein product [Caenorhabditis auriculariae]|uniref:WD_REPEATS_REGION domain-containing protein n=1 Tax=Caenorhabditis auriculariae TaxID=2777116 RepID=A0A8S1H3E1_9PELO|nr:unnamed protein product [Caenorhabditis auriculariae]